MTPLTCLVLASPIILIRVWKLLLGPWSFPEPTCWLRLARAFAEIVNEVAKKFETLLICI